MSKEIALEQFLDARGKLVKPGDPAPDEGEDNLAVYRSHGSIGPDPDKPAPKAKAKAKAKADD